MESAVWGARAVSNHAHPYLWPMVSLQCTSVDIDRDRVVDEPCIQAVAIVNMNEIKRYPGEIWKSRRSRRPYKTRFRVTVRNFRRAGS